jgi:uncharacterized protein (TIGR03435 family)
MRKIIFLCAMVTAITLLCAAAPAQSEREVTKMAGAAAQAAAQGATPNAPPSAEAKQLAAQIAAYATAQCGGKDPDAAPDCTIKALWAATQCPDKVATTLSSGTKTDTAHCIVPEHGFEYDVASIKPHKDDGSRNMMVGGTPDGYRFINVPIQNVVQNAYTTGLQMQITGGPAWTHEIPYDIEAKFVPEVADALKKLNRDDRSFVQRYMMQQLLKERMNFAAHVETKEVPSYDLVVGKNGPKLKDYDPNAKDNGMMRMQMDQGKMVLNAKGLQMAGLARQLGGTAGRPVFDKTGLTGMYDLTLEYARDQGLSATTPDGASPGAGPTMPADPAGPSLLDAVEQLGLKLVPSRGPMMVVVIERIEKPDAN